MDRRTFLKAAGSFAVFLPLAGSKAFAQDKKPYKGPFLICLNAEGGWDTTMFFDPKAGKSSKYNVTINTAYKEVKTLKGFSYAPVNFEYTTGGNTYHLHSPEEFLTNLGSRLRLFNGVDVATNAHPVGNQNVWSGHVATAYPSLGAPLAAKATQAPDMLPMPCAYITDVGAYTQTRGIVPASRVLASGMRSIAYEKNFPRTGGTQLFTEDTNKSIADAHKERVEQLRQQLLLPESKASLDSYDRAMLSKIGLERLAGELPSTSVTLNKLKPEIPTDVTTVNAALQQAELALYGFQTGTMASASISFGGFDTHTNNNTEQKNRLGFLFVLIEYILDKAKALGVDNLYVLVGSDFGRPPFYNDSKPNVEPDAADGKSHWNVSSYMLFGPNIQGGVLGKTDDNLEAQFVNPKKPSELLPEKDGGVILKPSHLHYALRERLGLAHYNSVYGLIDKSKPLNEGNKVSLL